jgi:hypothetical protein
MIDRPPAGIRTRQDLTGLQISYRQPDTTRHRILHAVGSLLMVVMPIGGAFVGAYPFAASFMSGGMGWFLLGAVLSLVGMVVGTGLGLAVSATFVQLIEWMMHVPTRAQVHISAHSIVLGGRTVPLAEVLFVDTEAQALVIQGGERLAIAAHTPDDQRQWVAAVLSASVDARPPAGTSTDIPAALAALQQPRSR